MSLDWNVKDVENEDEICWETAPETIPGYRKKGEQYMRAVTEALIWKTMHVGMHRITNENYEEFFLRVSMYERAHGASMQMKGKPVYLTLKDVRNHIGLRTNASPMTALQFGKAIVQRLRDDATRGMEREKREQADG